MRGKPLMRVTRTLVKLPGFGGAAPAVSGMSRTSCLVKTLVFGGDVVGLSISEPGIARSVGKHGRVSRNQQFCEHILCETGCPRLCVVEPAGDEAVWSRGVVLAFS